MKRGIADFSQSPIYNTDLSSRSVVPTSLMTLEIASKSLMEKELASFEVSIRCCSPIGYDNAAASTLSNQQMAHLTKVYGESIVKISRYLSYFCPTLTSMGKEFGNLYKINGIVYFRLSPYEQKAFKGVISKGVPNLIRRFQGSVFRVGPVFMFSYLLVCWSKEANHAYYRKNPKDYENDT